MKLEKLSATAEIVSSVAIVATLAYLAVQARQTNDMLLGNSRQATLMSDMNYLSAALQYPEEAARLLEQPPDDMRESTLLIIFFRTREFAWFQFRNGALDREALESYMRPVLPTLRSEIGASWWASIGQTAFDSEFVGFVNEWMSTADR